MRWPPPIAPWACLPPVVWPAPVTVYPNPCAQPFLLGNPPKTPGTGLLPGQGTRASVLPLTHDQCLEKWRAWQRAIGKADPIIKPLPGRIPPNLFICPPPRC